MSDVFARGRSGSFEFIDADAVLTPVETDAFLRRLNNELAWAHLAVRTARAREVECEKAFMVAKAPVLLEEEVPKVGNRAGEMNKTAADAWWAERLPEPYWALRSSQLERRNAQDYATLVQNQVEIMRSLNVNAKAIYESYRGGGR
ncbi:hypothetical protein [Acrocarpospora catenulata]|uniref:hypothetical protein n=1 Tax=Acrocarpospora catenulata TaxID=2836182 RepID=UPI001BDAB217|nr:hypothetical protein [Acrocarpospora catenulata]